MKFLVADYSVLPVLPAKDEPPKGQARCLSVLRLPTSLNRVAQPSTTTRLLALISLVAEGKKLEDHGGLVWVGRCLCRRGIACLGHCHVHTVLMMI